MKAMYKNLFVFLGILSLFTSCRQEIPTVSLGLSDVYYLPRMKAYRFTPGFTGETYRWSLILPDGRDSLLSEEHYYTFVQKDEGTYNLRFEIIDKETPYIHNFTVNVVHELVEYSRYISRVLEYKPAPGQFINEIPEYVEGDTEESIRIKVEQSISGRANKLVSLGGYGGYVTFGFDHTVINVPNERDFIIFGNAFYSLVDVGKKGGSCEPGIVMVAFDKNQNGKPDESEWFELAGSEYYKPETKKNYEITYYRPDPNKTPEPDETGNITDSTYIKWTDNYNKTGYISKVIFHKQDYYPKWLSADKLTFKGTCLKNNAEEVSGAGKYWVQYAYDWGYVDNHPNDSISLINFDIDWAVDNSGKKVYLPGVDFIKVYTGLNQTCGWLGETSTEIIRAEDLHIKKNK